MATTKGELLVKKWIKALRSGKYKQGRWMLARIYEEEGKKVIRYCPLGVLCDLAVKEGIIPKPKKRGSQLLFAGCGGNLPKKIQKLIKLRTDYGVHFVDSEYRTRSISSLNDHDKKKFSTIAKIIESRPEGLFED